MASRDRRASRGLAAAAGAALAALAALLALGSPAAAGAQDAAPGTAAARVELPKAGSWYRSNASGMVLESIMAREAPYQDYSLALTHAAPVGGPRPAGLPEALVPYYDASCAVELRILYEGQREIRRQWLFRDDQGVVRLNASGGGGLFGGAAAPGSGGEEPSGFIETFDAQGYITETRDFNADGSQERTVFFYNNGILIMTESWTRPAPASGEGEGTAGETVAAPASVTVTPAPLPGEEPETKVYTDRYRYTRSLSLRAIEREYHEAAAAEARLTFPVITPDFAASLASEISPRAYTNDFLEDVVETVVSPGTVVTYTTDDHGRVLSEVRKNEKGDALGVLRNTWSGSRLESVSWTADGDERLTEYVYDADGNRIMQRDYRSGVLERTFTTQGGQDIEELYLNGQVALRAVWENGRKISEERVRSTTPAASASAASALKSAGAGAGSGIDAIPPKKVVK